MYFIMSLFIMIACMFDVRATHPTDDPSIGGKYRPPSKRPGYVPPADMPLFSSVEGSIPDRLLTEKRIFCRVMVCGASSRSVDYRVQIHGENCTWEPTRRGNGVIVLRGATRKQAKLSIAWAYKRQTCVPIFSVEVPLLGVEQSYRLMIELKDEKSKYVMNDCTLAAVSP